MQMPSLAAAPEVTKNLVPLQEMYPDVKIQFLSHVLHDICRDELEVILALKPVQQLLVARHA